MSYLVERPVRRGGLGALPFVAIAGKVGKASGVIGKVANVASVVTGLASKIGVGGKSAKERQRIAAELEGRAYTREGFLSLWAGYHGEHGPQEQAFIQDVVSQSKILQQIFAEERARRAATAATASPASTPVSVPISPGAAPPPSAGAGGAINVLPWIAAIGAGVLLLGRRR